MKFKDIPYKRPSVEEAKGKMLAWQEAFSSAKTFEEQWKIMLDINELRKELFTAMVLVSIRHTVNTLDPFYEAENTFFDTNRPALEALNMAFYDMLLESPFYPRFEEELGAHFFDLIRLAGKTFSPKLWRNWHRRTCSSLSMRNFLPQLRLSLRGKSEHSPGCRSSLNRVIER